MSSESHMETVSSCAEQQLTELQMLQSMYSNDEMQFDSDCAPYILSYSELGEGSGDSGAVIEDVVTQLRDEDLRLGFTLKLLIHANPVEVKCDLPHSYPLSSPPLVFIRATGFKSRSSQANFRQKLDTFINELELGDAMLFSVFNWISDELPNYLQSEADNQDNTPVDGPCSFTRMWIYSHHIYSKFKRRDIIAWAAELKLHGFSMCGKPGMICVEGQAEDVEEYWFRLRRLNWKRLVMKEREDEKCESHKQLRECCRFDLFAENPFCARPGKGPSASFHSDLGGLLRFLQEHNSGHMFEIYFGIDGNKAETE